MFKIFVFKTYTLECLDYEFHIGNFSNVNGISHSDEELEREIKSQLMQEGTEEESQSYTPNGGYLPDDCADEDEDYGYEVKFREEMEVEGNGENGITNDECEYEDDGDDAWMEDDHLEEVDAPSPQPVAEDDMYGPIEEDDDITKDDISGSSNSSSSGVTSSSSSDSDNSGDDGSDSTESELESELGDFEAQMKQSIKNAAKSPHTKKNLNTTGKKSNSVGSPISLAALLGGGGAEEQDQDDSSDDSD
ncbi:hypothetical protein C1645_65122 [Glomus cerebriforme]|uniref:Uncharacterized protein n=1 Tax=Glomus cerebriforme TaxID=658196 RepID=A0A397T2V0_9GLOM|nr:hypothetical protein C1645_65122 [Glomus cerebriforme]